MDPIENSRAVAQELISFARLRNVDLGSSCLDGHFHKEQRWIYLWRKDELPYSGPQDEVEGTLHYNMQGAIAILPESQQGSASSFRGVWSEAGTFETIEQAFEFVKAWLLDEKEVDDLPQRQVRRYGIG
jgi:hypothetical protein